jgi:hypothetical protein
MRAILGWALALVAGAFLGAAVYESVLSDPASQLAVPAVVPSGALTPEPAPALYRTEIREVVEPTPTVTVVDEIVVTKTAAPAAPRVQTTGRTAKPAPTKSTKATRAPKSDEESARESGEREHEDSEDHEDEHEDHGDEHEDHEED